MGILNITPDSFSDGGKYYDDETALKQIKKLISDGATIIDIGAESTRPNANLIETEEEWARLSPLLKTIKKENLSIVLSIDTRKAQIAKKSIDMGASIINDVSSMEDQNGKIAEVIANNQNVFLVLNHHRGIPAKKNNPKINPNVIDEIISFFENKIEFAIQKGCKENQLILDPGLGFGKGTEENLLIINKLSQIKEHFNLPIMIGPSRKRFIKDIWGEEGQDWGSMAISLLGLNKGADIVRCHEPWMLSKFLEKADSK